MGPVGSTGVGFTGVGATGVGSTTGSLFAPGMYTRFGVPGVVVGGGIVGSGTSLDVEVPGVAGTATGGGGGGGGSGAWLLARPSARETARAVASGDITASGGIPQPRRLGQGAGVGIGCVVAWARSARGPSTERVSARAQGRGAIAFASAGLVE